MASGSNRNRDRTFTEDLTVAVSGWAVAYASAGGVLVYSGIKGATISDTVKSVLSGNLNVSETEPVNFGGTGTAADTGAANQSAAKNQALAKTLAASMGLSDWTTGQAWTDWVSLWNRESGWSNTADTRKTGAGGDNASSAVFAYGIAQARPYSKMPQSAWPPDKGGSADATAQITWGIGYIQGSYGSPVMAWAHEQTNGWY